MTENLEGSALVYDVGGSHVAAAVCFAGDYRLGHVVSVPHPREETAEAFVEMLHALGSEAAEGFAAVEGASLAFPGPFEYEHGMSRMTHKLPYLFGVDLRGKLAARFGWNPAQIRFLKDASAFLLGEIGAGAAQGVGRAVGVTLGTGIGAAFAIAGQVVTEGKGVPPGGEIWDLPYEGGIIEDSVSTRGIRGSYQRRTGEDREVAELAKMATTDADAAAAFNEFGHHVGVALRGALSDFAPQVIVLGGGISRSPQLFLPAAQRELNSLRAELRVSTLLDNAALAGAGVEFFSHPAAHAKPLNAAAEISAG